MKLRWIIIIGIFAIATIFWRRWGTVAHAGRLAANPATAAPSAHTATLPKKAPSDAQSILPPPTPSAATRTVAVASPAASALPAIPGAPAGQNTEIAAALKDLADRLSAGDTAGVLRDYGGPDLGRASPGIAGPTPAQYVQLLDKHRLEMTWVLQSLEVTTPVYALSPSNLDFYFYDIPDPITGAMERFSIYKSPTGWVFDFGLLPQWDDEAKSLGQQ